MTAMNTKNADSDLWKRICSPLEERPTAYATPGLTER